MHHDPFWAAVSNTALALMLKWPVSKRASKFMPVSLTFKIPFSSDVREQILVLLYKKKKKCSELFLDTKEEGIDV